MIRLRSIFTAPSDLPSRAAISSIASALPIPKVDHFPTRFIERSQRNGNGAERLLAASNPTRSRILTGETGENGNRGRLGQRIVPNALHAAAALPRLLRLEHVEVAGPRD